MSLVLDAFAESWDTTGMTLCQISDCSMRLIRGRLPAQSVNANCGYKDMWHATRKTILLTVLSLKWITQHGGGSGDTTELMDLPSQCLLLGVTQYGKGACIGKCEA